MNTLASVIENYSHARVLVIGDVMLDIYIHGSVNRISPEAPIPILQVEETKEMLGGAGNVVTNLSALGANSSLISVVGNDESGNKIDNLLSTLPGASYYLLPICNLSTVVKTRFVAGNQQILRTDVEAPHLVPASCSDIIVEKAQAGSENCNVILLSDYKKGVLSQKTTAAIIDIGKKKGIPILVDPKGTDYSMYRNATLIKPNVKELGDVFNGQDIKGREVRYARKLIAELNITYCLLTMGKDGMMLISNDEAITFNASKKDVWDVSGAGDTVIATLAASFGANATIEEACFMANTAAGIVVSKPGTSFVSPYELLNEIEPKSKVFNLPQLMIQIDAWKKRGYKIGLANGCFDVLHAGHINTLAYGKRYCDKLIVALNSDYSVRKLKGLSRPINRQEDRSLLISGLETIDGIILFEEETPELLIKNARPDFLIKGADYNIEDIVGKNFIESYGGKVILAPILKGLSTSKLLSRMESSQVTMSEQNPGLDLG